MSRFLILIFGCFTFGFGEVQLQEVINYEKQLYQDLKGSQPLKPPSKHGESIQVQLDLELSHIISLDERTETLSLNGLFAFVWHDPRLQWDPAKYENIDVIHVPDHSIWKPDISLYNSADASKYQPFGDIPVVVSASGLVMWVPPATLHSICPVDLRFYPLDEQTCLLRFGSWTYDAVKLNVTATAQTEPSAQNLTTQFFDQNNEWELVESSVVRTEQRYDCCSEVYPTIDFSLRLRRRSLFYKFTLIIPCLVTVILTLVLFWLPPTAGEKTLLGGVNCILLMLLLNHLSWRLPNNGSNAPAIVVFCGNSLVFAALSFILSVTTITMSRSRPNRPLPHRLEKCFTGLVGKILCLSSQVNFKKSEIPSDAKLLSSGNVELIIEQSDIGVSAPDPNYAWIILATALDRIFFFFYCFIYIIIIISTFV